MVLKRTKGTVYMNRILYSEVTWKTMVCKRFFSPMLCLYEERSDREEASEGVESKLFSQSRLKLPR